GVELRQDDREGGQTLLGNHVHWDPGTGVADGHGVVRMEGRLDEVVAAGERLVDGVVHNLVDQVMEASRARRADVHAGSQTDGLEALENGDVLCGVGGFSHQKSPASGRKTVYQPARSDGSRARLVAMARATVSRSSSSSIPAVIAAARSRCSGRGLGGAARGAAGSSAGPRSGPGAERIRSTPTRSAISCA